MGAEGLILCLRQRPQLLLGLTEGLVDERLLRLEQLPARGHAGRALVALELLGSLGLDLRREPLLLGRDLFVIVRRDLRRLFLGLAADGGGFRFGVRENAGGDLFNSVHRFALLYRVTC